MKTIELNNNQSILIQTLVTKENFYAEPGFSDVSPEDVVTMLQDKMDQTTVKRTLTSLYRKGLLFTDSFEDMESNEKGRWVTRKYKIVYLAEGLYHMVGWDKNYYGTSETEDIKLIYTENEEQDKEVNPTGPRGPLAELTEVILNIKEEGNVIRAIDMAMGKTDLKNAKTAMAKFIKSNRMKARYYGITITKYDHTL
jgi:hypothetical protein